MLRAVLDRRDAHVKPTPSLIRRLCKVSALLAAAMSVGVGGAAAGTLAGHGVGVGAAGARLLRTGAALIARAGAPRAHVAHVLKASDTAHLRYLSASGSILFEEGRASGTLLGSMRVRFSVGATFSGSFTIYTAGGSIAGHGVATPHGSGVYESFAGSLTVTGGSGRYAHARGNAQLYGTFNRNTYALLVQTVGTLHY
jgi:hypothetical protein